MKKYEVGGYMKDKDIQKAGKFVIETLEKITKKQDLIVMPVDNLRKLLVEIRYPIDEKVISLINTLREDTKKFIENLKEVFE